MALHDRPSVTVNVFVRVCEYECVCVVWCVCVCGVCLWVVCGGVWCVVWVCVCGVCKYVCVCGVCGVCVCVCVCLCVSAPARMCLSLSFIIGVHKYRLPDRPGH